MSSLRKGIPCLRTSPSTQAAVRDLKRQITQLGEVNLGAIDEYERGERAV